MVSNPSELRTRSYDDDFHYYRRKTKKRNRKNKKHKSRNHNKKQPNNIDNDEHLSKVVSLQKHLLKKLANIPNPTEWHGDNGYLRDYAYTNDTDWSASIDKFNQSDQFEYGRNLTFVDEDDHREKVQTKKNTWRSLTQENPPADISNGLHTQFDGYFCDTPNKEYAHFVLQRIGPNDTDSLFDLNGFLAMCEMQHQIETARDYSEYCLKGSHDNCCRPWSLPNYGTLLANKSSCFDLNVS